MLTPEQLQDLPQPIIDLYNELNTFILTDIARRIKKAGEITPTAEYQIYRAQALGMSATLIRDKIAEINEMAKSEVNRLIRDAARISDEFDRRMLKAAKTAAIPLSENAWLQQIIDAQIRQAQGAIDNITGTTGFAYRNAAGKTEFIDVTSMLRRQMDKAHNQIVTGVVDHNTAIRRATNELIESGVRTVNYESGYTSRIDVAVRRAVMTGTSQVTNRISEANYELLGADGWEISAHSGARPSHAIHQGKQFPESDYETIVKPLLDDYNCKHSGFPIKLGISEPVYTDEELANIDIPPVTYDGKTYTAYEATQEQRRMERVMRKQKGRLVVAEATGDKEAFTTASIKLKQQKQVYKDFSDKAGLYTQNERTQVYGFNRSVSQKAVHSNKKALTYDKLVGVTTSTGVTITEVSDHLRIRGISRGFTADEAINSLTNPLDVGKIITDNKGKNSQNFINTVTVSINPDTGKAITGWRTSSKKINKLKGAT